MFNVVCQLLRNIADLERHGSLTNALASVGKDKMRKMFSVSDLVRPYNHVVMVVPTIRATGYSFFDRTCGFVVQSCKLSSAPCTISSLKAY
jgi:hypothetical protein